MPSPTQQLKTSIRGALTDGGAATELLNYLGNIAPTVGNVWYVNSGSGNDNNGGKTSTSAFATVDKAINSATASNNDVIYVLPGHTETIANATSLVPDVDGLSIIGVGTGADRPTLTFSATGSNIPISGASVTFSNFLFLTTGTIDVTAGITVTGADCLLAGIEMREALITSQIVDGIVVASGGDRCSIVDFIFLGQTASDQASAAAISITAAVNMVQIIRPRIIGSHSAGCIENVTAACTDLLIKGAIIEQRHTSMDAGITIVTTATGHIIDVWIRTATNDAGGFDAAITAGNDMQLFNALIVNDDGEFGLAWGTGSNNT